MKDYSNLFNVTYDASVQYYSQKFNKTLYNGSEYYSHFECQRKTEEAICNDGTGDLLGWDLTQFKDP